MLTIATHAIPSSERIDLWPMVTLRQSYDALVKALGQPHWREDTDFPGYREVSRVMWRIRDDASGAVLCVWDCDAGARTAADTTQWQLFWSDGLLEPASGRRLLDETIGSAAGGTITSLDDDWL